MIFRNVDCEASKNYAPEPPALKNDVKITMDTKRQFMSKNFEAVIRSLNTRLNILEESISNPTEDERTEIWDKRLYLYQSQIGQKLSISEATHFSEVRGWVALEMAVKYLQAQCWDNALERLAKAASRQPDISECKAFNHLEQMAKAGQLWKEVDKNLKSMVMLCSDPEIEPYELSKKVNLTTKAINSAREIIKAEALNIVFGKQIRGAEESLLRCQNVANIKELLSKGQETLQAGQSASDIVMRQKYCRQTEQHCQQAKELAKKLPATQAAQYVKVIETLSTKIETHKNDVGVINAIFNQTQKHFSSGEYAQALALLLDSTTEESFSIQPLIVEAKAGKKLQKRATAELEKIKRAFSRRDSLSAQKEKAEQLRSWHTKSFKLPTQNRDEISSSMQFNFSPKLIKDIKDVIKKIDIALQARECAEQGFNTGNYQDTLDAMSDLTKEKIELTKEELEWQQKAAELLANIELAKTMMSESGAIFNEDKLRKICSLLDGNVHKAAKQLFQKASGVLLILEARPTAMDPASLVSYTQQCRTHIREIEKLDFSASEKDNLIQYIQTNIVTYIEQVNIGALDNRTPEQIKELYEQLCQIQQLVPWVNIPAIAEVMNEIVEFIDDKLRQDNSSLETIRHTLENWMRLRIELFDSPSKIAKAYVQKLLELIKRLAEAMETSDVRSILSLPPEMLQSPSVEMFFQLALVPPPTVPSELLLPFQEYRNTIERIFMEWYEKIPELLFNDFRKQIKSLKVTPQEIANKVIKVCNKEQPSASWAVQDLHRAFYVAIQDNIETNPNNEDIYVSFAIETIEKLLYQWAKMILEDTDDLQDIRIRLTQVVQVLALAEYFPYPEKESRQILLRVLQDAGKDKKTYESILKMVTGKARQAYFKEEDNDQRSDKKTA